MAIYFSDHHAQEPRVLTTLKDFIFLQENPIKPSFKNPHEKHPKFNLRNSIRTVIAAMKKSSFLPRSLSRKLLKKKWKDDERENDVNSTVKLKDIIKWKSFHYFEEENSQATTTTTSSSNGSSWCESDFTAEDFPAWNCNGDSGEGKTGIKYVSEESTWTEAHGEDDKKAEALSRCGDEEEDEELEKRAKRLLNHVKTSLLFSEIGCEMEGLFLDFFREELSSDQERETDDGGERNGQKLMKKVEDWMRGGEDGGSEEWGRKETYVREMERERKWKVMGDGDKVELGFEIEYQIFGSLVEELLFDL